MELSWSRSCATFRRNIPFHPLKWKKCFPPSAACTFLQVIPLHLGSNIDISSPLKGRTRTTQAAFFLLSPLLGCIKPPFFAPWAPQGSHFRSWLAHIYRPWVHLAPNWGRPKVPMSEYGGDQGRYGNDMKPIMHHFGKKYPLSCVKLLQVLLFSQFESANRRILLDCTIVPTPWPGGMRRAIE